MELSNVPWEWDYPFPGNKTIQCTLGMGQANSLGNGTSQCALEMGLVQCAQGIVLANVPWE